MSQSVVTLYIYRVGWTYPAKNPVYRSKSIENPNCTRTPLGPVRPVRPTGQTGRSYQIDYSNLYRSDRLEILVRPVPAKFSRQHMPPVLWQSLRVKEHSSGLNLSKDDDQ